MAPFAGWVIALTAVGMALAQQHAYLFQLSPAAISRLVYGSNPFPEAVEIARYVREHSAPTDRIAVIGSEPRDLLLRRPTGRDGLHFICTR